MPPSPVPPTPPSDEERPATVLETDEDILKALKRPKPAPRAASAPARRRRGGAWTICQPVPPEHASARRAPDGVRRRQE